MGIKYVVKQQKAVVAFVIAAILSLVSVFAVPLPVSAQAQACAVLPDTYGRITLPKADSPVTVTQQTEYTIWIRMRVKDAAHKISVSVDSTDSAATCGVEMGGGTANEWTWVKSKLAGGDFKATIPANSNVKVQIAGLSSSPNVDIDKVMLVSDSCVPSNTAPGYGDNCTETTPTPTPTVGPSTTPTPNVNLTIYDIDGSGTIGVGDLSRLIQDYPRQTGPVITDSPADFNNSGRVDINDLSTLLRYWGLSV